MLKINSNFLILLAIFYSLQDFKEVFWLLAVVFIYMYLMWLIGKNLLDIRYFIVSEWYVKLYILVGF